MLTIDVDCRSTVHSEPDELELVEDDRTHSPSPKYTLEDSYIKMQ